MQQPDGSYVRSIGAGLFSDNLHGLFVTPRQTLRCTDGDRHAVREISLEDGRLIRDFGRLDEPSDTGYETDMYTWLKREGKIPAHFAPFSSTIAFIDRFDTIKRAGAPFNKPTRMIEAPNGDFFATDGYGNAAVHHFAPDGSLIKTWGGPGRGEGQFRLPHGLWLDSRSRLWVADRENNRVQVFTTGGELLAVIDGLYRPAEIWADGAHVYVGEVDGGVTILDMDMQICAQLGFFYSSLIAHGLCGDGQGNLYIQTLWFQKSSNVMRLKRL